MRNQHHNFLDINRSNVQNKSHHLLLPEARESPSLTTLGYAWRFGNLCVCVREKTFNREVCLSQISRKYAAAEWYFKFLGGCQVTVAWSNGKVFFVSPSLYFPRWGGYKAPLLGWAVRARHVLKIPPSSLNYSNAYHIQPVLFFLFYYLLINFVLRYWGLPCRGSCCISHLYHI